ncbi:glycosyltransferase family 2 protein [Acidobacteriota bacterium]
MIVNRDHRPLFKAMVDFYNVRDAYLRKLIREYRMGSDQTPLNFIVAERGYKKKYLPREFNFMHFIPLVFQNRFLSERFPVKRLLKKGYIFHFMGMNKTLNRKFMARTRDAMNQNEEILLANKGRKNQKLKAKCGKPGEPAIRQEPLCPKVSIIIPVYNRGFMLQRVIRSLLDQTYPHIEIIMIDDGSTDDSYAIMRQYPQIYAITQGNRGPAAARNTGLKQTTGDILLFMDSDAIAPVNLVEIHVKTLRKYPDAIVQGQVISIMDLDDAFVVPFSLRHYSRAFFATGNVSVRKRYIDAVDGFDDTTFRKGWEDLDLGLRLRKHGLKVKRLYKQGYIWHFEGTIGDKKSISDFFADRLIEGCAAVDFYRKHPSFSIKLMTMAGGFFFFLDKILFNESYLESTKFHNRIYSLWNRDKKDAAVSKMHFAGYHFYLKGIRERIKEDGYLLDKSGRRK